MNQFSQLGTSRTPRFPRYNCQVRLPVEKLGPSDASPVRGPNGTMAPGDGEKQSQPSKLFRTDVKTHQKWKRSWSHHSTFTSLRFFTFFMTEVTEEMRNGTFAVRQLYHPVRPAAGDHSGLPGEWCQRRIANNPTGATVKIRRKI